MYCCDFDFVVFKSFGFFFFVFDSAAKRCDPKPRHVPGSLWEAAGAPPSAGPALPEAPPAVRALRGDDL